MVLGREGRSKVRRTLALGRARTEIRTARLSSCECAPKTKRQRLTSPSSCVRALGAIVERGRPGGGAEVSLLGSYNADALRGKVEDAVRRWAFSTGNPAARVEAG